MRFQRLLAIALSMLAVSPASAQVRSGMSGNLLFKLADSPAGSEGFHIRRLLGGSYRPSY
ncbi:MAG: hypothetical protein AMS21_06455 [Gemmatimonas sp. SG8_38_2]|nr:MAG: hypothetical protein AMS21_06455 [Gemmatimonas sp. SG8_38_2]